MRTVLAYGPDGNVRVPTPIEVGWEIDWKRNGTAGYFRCVVRELDVSPATKRVERLRVWPVEHQGRAVSMKARWVTQRGVIRVYPIPPERQR